MTICKTFEQVRTQAVAVALLIVLGTGQCFAGAEEDLAAGRMSYQRGDFATAIPLLRKSADAGNSQAQVLLASVLDAADSDEEAVAYYRKAAAIGNLDGIFGLANMLATGEGVKKDPEEARRLFIKAAEAGHKPAIAMAAQMYLRGDLGISEADRKGKEALKWITLAADDGSISALEALEQAYRTGGYGVAVDPAKADALKQKIVSIKGVKEKKSRRGEKR